MEANGGFWGRVRAAQSLCGAISGWSKPLDTPACHDADVNDEEHAWRMYSVIM
jgi:hypothetical protein